MKDLNAISTEVINLLKELIQTPSISKNESQAALKIQQFLVRHDISFKAKMNNTWCFNRYFSDKKPTILLNSHIDTVKPTEGWLSDPFNAQEFKGKIIGLGSNDAGGALVALLATFLHFYEDKDLPYNLCFAATAEEEISGINGISSIEEITSKCSFAIIGEPTEMHMASAERGLIVVDAVTKGRTGHAARAEGVNALYLALDDINWIRNFTFDKTDPFLGPIKMTVTMLSSGYQHNVVPDICQYVIDIRTVNTYTYDEILATIRANVNAVIQPRSTRLKPSSISPNHLLIKAAKKLGIPIFGSTTLSDQSLLNIPSVKIGPGKSKRSHTPEEFIFKEEIEDGIKTYICLIKEILNQ